MKKVLIILVALIGFGMIMNAQNNMEEKGIIIEGVRWATKNVDVSGVFVISPEKYGEPYTWDEAQNACPTGWRLPTQEELQSLIDAGGNRTKVEEVNGLVFGSENNAIFLPAAGLCGGNNEIAGQGNFCTYWSSTSGDDNSAWELFSFGSKNKMFGSKNKMKIHDSKRVKKNNTGTKYLFLFLDSRSVLRKNWVRCVAE